MKLNKGDYMINEQAYLDKNTIRIIDRDGVEYRGYYMKFDESKKANSILPKALTFLLMSNTIATLYPWAINDTYELTEQYAALYELITMGTNGTVKDFDLEMAKKAILNYSGMMRSEDRMKTIECGTQIKNREGRVYTAYSYKLTDYEKAMDLLSKVDVIYITSNFDTEQTDESYESMLEIIYLSLNEKVPKEEIEKSIDAEFARKVLRIYYDLPQLF